MAPISFQVRRCEPELVAPSEPTPRELKPLSDVDDQIGLRFQIPIVQVYKSNPSMKRVDPVSVIRESLAKALVFYYPFAGRLRSLEPSGKLAVDCTGEGVWFIEADADVTLSQLGELQAPFPCFDQLLYDVPGSGEITDCPVSLFQVTRFLCGGFILAMRHNHTMSDAPGLIQFLTAIAEIACGATSPSVQPVWQRHLLNARDPPRVTCSHPEFDEPESTTVDQLDVANEDFSHRAFFFGAREISSIRRQLPPRQRGSSTFDVVAAYLWRTRVVALELEPSVILHGIVNVNVRSKIVNPSPLPKGFYGNSFAFASARTTAGDISGKPLGYAVELVRKAKESVNEEFMRSMVDLVVKKGRARFPATRPYIMSDIRYAGFGDVDFGWGKPVYGGVAGAIPGDAGFIVRFKNGRGEEGVSVAVCLPKQAMERFEKHFDSLSLSSAHNEEYKLNIMSAL